MNFYRIFTKFAKFAKINSRQDKFPLCISSKIRQYIPSIVSNLHRSHFLLQMESDSKDMTIEQLNEQLNNLKKDLDGSKNKRKNAKYEL